MGPLLQTALGAELQLHSAQKFMEQNHGYLDQLSTIQIPKDCSLYAVFPNAQHCETDGAAVSSHYNDILIYIYQRTYNCAVSSDC